MTDTATYTFVLPIPGQASLDDIDAVQSSIREVGAAIVDHKRRRIEVVVERSNLWVLRGVMEDLIVNLTNNGFEVELDITKVRDTDGSRLEDD